LVNTRLTVCLVACAMILTPLLLSRFFNCFYGFCSMSFLGLGSPQIPI
jgi:hypothetical protein